MRFKVPQDVQREDTIIGPITLKQLMILGIGGAITYSVYLSLDQIFIFEVTIIPTAILAIITITFTFIKIHELTFTQYLLHLMEYLFMSKRRAWQQGTGEVFVSELSVVKKSKEELEAEKKQEEHKEKIDNLDHLSKILDKHHK